MMIRNLSVFGIFVGSFIAGCGSAPGREPGCPAVPAEILSGVDTVVPDSVRMRAVLRYDSVSFVVLENRSRLPVACRSGYRFEQWVGNRWKTVPVREKDTAWVFLPPGKTDTSFFRLERDLGYAPLGLCRIGKTVKVLSVPWQTFELRCEAEARPGKIDWNRMELVPDNRVANTLFVDMKVVSVEKDAVLVTLRNKSDRELVFGDYTDCSFCRYEDGKWLKISYASVIHSVAVMLTPGDTLSGWKHFLPKRLYAFPPGRYRVVKPFFFQRWPNPVFRYGGVRFGQPWRNRCQEMPCRGVGNSVFLTCYLRTINHWIKAPETSGTKRFKIIPMFMSGSMDNNSVAMTPAVTA